MDHNASTRRAQARTLLEASAWGEPWAGHELDIVRGFPEDTAEELALTLGRTVYSVQSVREALRRGQPIGGGQARRPARQERGYDYVTTFPPGHFD